MKTITGEIFDEMHKVDKVSGAVTILMNPACLSYLAQFHGSRMKRSEPGARSEWMLFGADIFVDESVPWTWVIGDNPDGMPGVVGLYEERELP